MVDPKTPNGLEFLKKALGRSLFPSGRQGFSSYTGIDALEHLESLEQDFEKWLDTKASLDPGCTAKIGLAKALVALEASSLEPLPKGLTLVQKEASYGPPIDTAAELRGICCIGLVRCGAQMYFRVSQNSWLNPEPMTRYQAARAAAETGESIVPPC